ncbi:MAG: glycosyltransferase [Candidatus Aenigmatarchaeota archaeon]
MPEGSRPILSKNINSSIKPKVTVGTCVRNCQETIGKTLESIMEQDFPHELMEVIFVDDGSEDATLSIIKKYIPKMTMQVKVFHHEWMGLGPSRNVVVENASGEFIIWVDGDMVLPKDHVRKQVDFMEANPDVGVAKARYGLIPDDNLVAMLENLPYIVTDYDASKPESRYPGTGGSIYRVKAIRQVGGFDNCLKGVGEDQDAAYRIKEAGWQIKRSDAYFFEMREQNWRDLWRKYYWYGYGNYYLYRKNKSIFKLCLMIPPAGFVIGLFYSFRGYKCIRKAIVFLLPLHYLFKKTAWFLGFLHAHFKAKFQNKRK